jgi:benzodiazapine receptor
MKLVELSKILLSIIICQAAGVVGSVFTSSSVFTWYPTLIKPSFTPPGWIIGIVWTILFTLMGISLFLIWQEGPGRADVKRAIYIFAAQLVVNMLWSWAFFGLQSPLSGLAVIIVLWILIILTMVKFRPISWKSALLLVPYILWVSFAALLNFIIWRLN